MKSFKDKVVVITGAGAGMGRSYALAFAKLGAKLSLADYDSKGLEETVSLAARLTTHPIFSQSVDVSSLEQMEQFAADTRANLGNAHVIINNAGISGEASSAWETTEKDFNRVMQINLNGVVYGTRYFMPQLLANGEGAVVNISSVFGLVGMPSTSSYCASKFAVRGFTESLMVELHNTDISVHLVHPGGVKTNIASGTAEGKEFEEKYLRTTPDEIAEKVIAGILSGEPRIVCGYQSSKVQFLGQFLPLKTRTGVVFDTIMKSASGADYKGVKRKKKKGFSKVLVGLVVFAALLVANHFGAF